MLSVDIPSGSQRPHKRRRFQRRDSSQHRRRRHVSAHGARVGEKEIPILGINTGHLGYLADVTVNEANDKLQNLLAGKYHVESRTMIAVTSPDAKLDLWRYALNEVAILKEDTSSMIEMEATVDDSHLATYLADGLIGGRPLQARPDTTSLSAVLLWLPRRRCGRFRPSRLIH